MSINLIICFILLSIPSSLSNPSLSCVFDPFECGEIKAEYPFWGGHMAEICGHPDMQIHCEPEFPHNQNASNITTMIINEVKYKVLNISYEAQTLKIARTLDHLIGFCPDFANSTFDSPLFDNTSAYQNATLFYDCPSPSPPGVESNSCNLSGVEYKGHLTGKKYKRDDRLCTANVSVPVPESLLNNFKQNASVSEWKEEILNEGFELKWKIGGVNCEACNKSMGICGYDHINNETICYCNIAAPDQPPNHIATKTACPPPHHASQPGTHLHFNYYL